MTKEQLQPLIDKQLSQRDMANTLGVSQTTVRYWLRRLELKTKHNRHRKRNGPNDPRYIQRECKHHGMTEHILESSRNAYRCKMCRSGRVSRERRELKARLVREAGDKCIKCGYNRCIWALQFHHRDPSIKEFEIGFLIRDRKYKEAKREALKCDLVCANCHAELESAKW